MVSIMDRTDIEYKRLLVCKSCGSTNYPYHKEYCDMGIIADWEEIIIKKWLRITLGEIGGKNDKKDYWVYIN